MSLTKGDDDGAGDAVGHDDGEDAAGPGVLQPKLELVGLALRHNQQRRYCLCLIGSTGLPHPA